jgi:hypothetical protein
VHGLSLELIVTRHHRRSDIPGVQAHNLKVEGSNFPRNHRQLTPRLPQAGEFAFAALAFILSRFAELQDPRQIVPCSG